MGDVYASAHLTISAVSSEHADEGFWRYLVTAFSRRELTFTHDKFPALDGLCQVSQSDMAHERDSPAPSYLWGCG
ncbi:hypothetical protein PG994_006598 [Apiospora phragmitis]|uniref:Uncharacterized protein n=1 Tax=Apiospora phragmitis TaxID=2905665 RepID=A0ABR1VGH4_9PEZI